MGDPKNEETQPAPIAMGLAEHIELVEKMVVAKNYSIPAASGEIRALFNRMQQEIIPESSFRAASILIGKWGDDLLGDYKEKWKVIYANLLDLKKRAEELKEKTEGDADSIVSIGEKLKAYLAGNKNPDPDEIAAMTQRMPNLATPKDKEDRAPKPPGLEQVFDYTAMEELVKKTPHVAGLDQFIKDSDKSLRQARQRFNRLGATLLIFNLGVISAGLILSYFIGDWLENPVGHYLPQWVKLEYRHVILSFAALIICLLTADHWVEEAKGLIFWRFFARSATAKNKEIADDFLRLERQFIANAKVLLQNESNEGYSARLNEIRALLDLDPFNMEAYQERIRVRQASNDEEGAKQDIEFFDTMIRRLVFARGALEKGLICVHEEAYEKAIDYFTYAISLDILPEMAFHYRGMAKIKVEDYRGAIKDLERVVELNPANENALILLKLARGAVTGRM